MDELISDECKNCIFSAFKQFQPKWIPVTERLPEKHEEVLVTVAGEIVIAWLYLDGRWRSNDCPETYLNDFITAWMPLPEPYRKETEDGKDH